MRAEGYTNILMDTFIKIPYKPNEKQILAHLAMDTFECILYGGAVGGGKSFWLCICIIYHALQYPGSRICLARKEKSTLVDSTLVKLFELIPDELMVSDIGWGHNEQKGIIRFPNGSIIKYGGVGTEDDMQKLGSTEFSLVCIDEAGEIDLKPFLFLQSRLRHVLPDGTRPKYQCLLASNPSHNWLKEWFIDSPREGFTFIQALPYDNKENLSQDYITRLERIYTPEMNDIYLKGDWNALSSDKVVIPYKYIQDAINRELPIVDIPVIGVDPAGDGGDENVIVYAKGNTILGIHSNRKMNSQISCAKIAHYAHKLKAKKILIEIDGMGKIFLQRLKGMGVKASEFRSGGNKFVSDKEMYYNHKTEAYFYARGLFEDGLVSIPDDKMLINQLASIKYEIRESHGKLKIESKDKMSKKMGNSPDRADAVIIALWAAKGMRDPKRDFARKKSAPVTPRGNSYGWKN